MPNGVDFSFKHCDVAGALDKVAKLPGGADAVQATCSSASSTTFPVKLV